MSSAERSSLHEETRLLLPWLANGRLPSAQRERAEEHVRLCTQCAQELSVQRRLCEALSAPERVTYAPGPSFRKLLDRLDGPSSPARGEADVPRVDSIPPRSRRSRGGSAALWRPPGLAWAASFIIMVGMTGLMATITHRWSQPVYSTVTDPQNPADVLQVAFDRELTIGEVQQLLRADGATVVAGPDTSGIFNIAPDSRVKSRDLRQLWARLKADPRVRWLQPIDTDGPTPDQLPHREP
jgi:hypothetical protein